VAVETTNMSTAAMSVVCRKLREVGEGSLGREGMFLPTVA
jgi:hypothetical protein